MRSLIASKLAQGVNMTSILDFIRDSQIGPLSRDHLTTRSDIHNIKHQYNINYMQKDNDDAKSMMYWVAEMEQETGYNPVICYKGQGEDSCHMGLNNKYFLLGIQTEFQKEMFVKYAHKLVCADATHGTNAYDFQLITVLVVDDYDEGIPVAWLISNRECAEVLSVFSCMRERCGDVATDVFMSDDADAYYNAWVSTFPRPNKKLLCSWHVDRSWRRKLNEHIRDRAVLAEVYAAMKRVQNETNEAVFRRSLQQFLAWVRGLSEPLATYFEREYARRTREWASCFRLGSRVNTNMFLESFHRVLKEVYLERKQNRRVDHLLYKLLKISRDKAYEQWIKAEKGKTTLRQRESNKRQGR